MRKQKILTLHRQHAKRPGRPVFVRFNTDGESDIRPLADLDKVLVLGQVQETYGRLHPRALDFKDMAPADLAAFIRSIGVKIDWSDDGPNCEFFQSAYDNFPH